jgi:hypothetical protein
MEEEEKEEDKSHQSREDVSASAPAPAPASASCVSVLRRDQEWSSQLCQSVPSEAACCVGCEVDCMDGTTISRLMACIT